MRVVVGLGNPGEKYRFTRHNIGYICIDEFAQRFGVSFKYENKFKSQIAKIDYNGENLLLVKPETYMNLSGEAIRAIYDFYKLGIKDFLIIYDDISLNLGKMRFRASGSDGGHNGIKSIIQNLSTQEFDRLKIGIGPQPEKMPLEHYVLQNFSKEQIEALSPIVEKVSSACEYYIKHGINQAQSLYN